MKTLILLQIVLSWILLTLPSSFSSTISVLERGSSLSPSKNVAILSQNGKFSAGFYSVGDNAYCFAIWFTHEMSDGNNTIVWMANRDEPVNGKQSKFSLLKSGELVLFDAGDLLVWSSETNLRSYQEPVHLKLQDDGNLVLSADGGKLFWQSFESPTNTILPGQMFTRNTKLVSYRSNSNFSSGLYRLYFDNGNLLRLLFDNIEITSIFWPDPWQRPWEVGRSTYNNSKVASLDSAGVFMSSDNYGFRCSDYGVGPQRRMTLDVDGNLRVYSFDEVGRSWIVTWQANSRPCMLHGICGANSICSYAHDTGRDCSCIPGYKMKNNRDGSEGCVPTFNHYSKDDIFIELRHVEFYGYDVGYFPNYTYTQCADACLNDTQCRGIQYKFDDVAGFSFCFTKNLLYNGFRSGNFSSPMFIRLPRKNKTSYEEQSEFHLDVCGSTETVLLEREYYSRSPHSWLKPLILATSMIGAFEIICMLIFLAKTRLSSNSTLGGYLQVATGFKKFRYDELRKATKNFSQEIGRGGGGIVYKGKLSDNRIAAIKGLGEASQGEAEFLAEVSTIGRLNHMNLIDIWGHCVEGKHRFLVYEYMENGSLAENLYSKKLDWEKRYQIALGTAKALAYLHEECLEWVLHCDVKPENILLDSNYQPKVADFGLSKLLNRSGIGNSKFSRMRGTRGYMAPEWVYDLPITSKVDVYSYGIVVLEMITGRKPIAGLSNNDMGRVADQTRLVSWVKEKLQGGSSIYDIVDPALHGAFEVDKMEVLMEVALQCAKEEGDARPTMSQVVHKLLHPSMDNSE